MRLARLFKPWPLVAGGATAVVGVALIFFAAFRFLSPVTAVAFVLAAALVELLSGLSLWRRGGPAMAHVFSGALALLLITYVIGAAGLARPVPLGPQPIAL